jgi:glyoxylase-like metal-dependent hydrolase (beta-lactamase superfamily II)
MLGELERAGITVFERGWLSSNNVLLRGGENDAAVIVDTGYWTHAPQTIALLKSALGAEPLGRIVNTHLHSDHCGGNAAIQQAFGCGADVPIGESAIVDAWDEEHLTFRATGQHCPRFRRTGAIESPGRIMAGRWSWEVIPSPGHDPKSVALYQPELEVLISADALWENGFGVVFPELDGEAAFADVGTTLDRFAQLSVRSVIPGHGAPFGDMLSAVDRARRRLDSFIADPHKHALHAAKVLVKFHLLEVQRETWAGLGAWLARIKYFDAILATHFPDSEPVGWSRDLVMQMDRSGALRIAGDTIFNA